ncbi:hypothetical protein ABK040_008888 [Willaertia magna]
MIPNERNIDAIMSGDKLKTSISIGFELLFSKAKHLSIEVSNVFVSTQDGMDVALEKIKNIIEVNGTIDHSVVGIVGAYYSSESIIVAREIAQVYKIPMISYGSSSSALSSNPWFFRAIPTALSQAQSIIDFMFALGWNEFGIIAANEEYGLNTANNVRDHALRLGMKVITMILVTPNKTDEYVDRLLLAKESGAKVFVCVLSTVDETSAILNLMKTLEMTNGEYTYIWDESFAYQPGIAAKKVPLDSNVQGMLYVQLNSGLWSSELHYVNRVREIYNITSYSEVYSSIQEYDRFSYDSTIAFSNALESLCEDELDPTDGYNMRRYLFRTMFVGASGRVTFDDNGDRLGIYYGVMNINGSVPKLLATWSQVEGITWDPTLEKSKAVNIPGGTRPFTNILRYSPLGSHKFYSIPNIALIPPDRHSYSAVVYSGNKDGMHMYIFGGTSQFKFGNPVYNDLWKYSFIYGMWFKVESYDGYSPRGREGHNMFIIIGEETDSIYVFGGKDTSFVDEMLVFNIDKHQWSVFNPPIKPSPRYMAKTVETPHGVFLFGGMTTTGVSDELWRFDTIALNWTNIPKSGAWPEARYSFCLGLHSNPNYLILFGGKNKKNEAIGDLWIYDITTNKWDIIVNVEGTPPMARFDAGCVHTDLQFYIIGGRTNAKNVKSLFLNDMYRAAVDLNTKTAKWRTAFPEIPKHTARSNISPVALYNYVVWFGGFGMNDDYNELYSLNVLNYQISKINEDSFSPGTIYGHTLNVLGNNFYIFGGFREDQPSNALYSYSIVDQVWRAVETKTQPDSRLLHGSVSVGDRLWVFGGMQNFNKIYSDIWSYTYSSDTWERHETFGDTPSPRFHHGMVHNGTNIFVLGGRGQTKGLESIYSFHIETLTWRKLDFTIPSAYTIGSGCHDFSESPAPEFYRIDFNPTTDTLVSTHFYPYPANIPARTGNSAAKLSGVRLVMFGGKRFSELFDNVLYFDGITGAFHVFERTSTNFIYPSPRTQHSSVVHGDSLFMYGGLGSPDGTSFLLPSLKIGEFWRFQLENICRNGTDYNSTNCLACSLGTYELNGVCLLCPPGYYNDVYSGFCKPCSKGFYNPIHGATSSDFCLPCGANTYSFESGSSSCKPCPEGLYCPLASFAPTTPLNFSTLSHFNEQPTPYMSKEADNNILVFTEVGFFALATCVIILLLFACWKLFNFPKQEWLQRMDIFFTERHNRLPGIMYKTRTIIGGFFTIILLSVVSAYLIATIVPYYNYNNYVENRSLIPNLSMENNNANFISDVMIKVAFVDFKGNCNSRFEGDKELTEPRPCSNTVRVTPSDEIISTKSETNYTCETVLNPYGDVQSCLLRIWCKQCSIARNTREASLGISLSGPNAFASGFTYSINVSSAYVDVYDLKAPPKRSVIFGYVRSPEGTFFRGPTPTKLTLQLVQNTYYIPFKDFRQYGYVIDYNDESLGSTVDYKTFSHENGVSLQILFDKIPSTLEVVLAEKKIMLVFFTDMLASLAGIFTATAYAMSLTEFFIFHSRRFYNRFMEARKRKKALKAARGELLDASDLISTDFIKLKDELVQTDENFYDPKTIEQIHYKKQKRRTAVYIPEEIDDSLNDISLSNHIHGDSENYSRLSNSHSEYYSSNNSSKNRRDQEEI